jgi:hypothetical protein
MTAHHASGVIPTEDQMIKKIILTSLIWSLFLVTSLLASEIRVSYISSENIYLDSGTSAGLEIGTVLVIRTNQKITSKFEVIYVAQNSASCKIITSDGKIKAGNVAEIFSRPSKNDTLAATIVSGAITESPTAKNKSDNKSTTSRIRGYLGLQWYSFHDKSENEYNYTQPAIRFKISGTGLMNNNLGFEIKLRARYYNRSNRTPTDEWRNRIYLFRLYYQNPASPVQISVGRIISNNISGAGYLDGLYFNHNLTANWYWGLMAGFKPDWQFSKFQTDEKKYGLFFGYQSKPNSEIRFDASLAANGEYHGSTVSREFLFIRSSLIHQRNWNIYHSMEIEINRDWRKERVGNTVSLSSLYISGQANLSNQISARLSYDNRRNYYRYEYMSLADSLFDDAFRQGLRLFIHYNPVKNIRLSLDGGLRKREDDSQTTYSYGAGLRVPKFFVKSLSFTTRIASFSNIYTRGINYSFFLRQRFYSSLFLGVDYGAHYYNQILNNQRYNSQWVRLNINFDLLTFLSMSGFYEYDFGDDHSGHRIFAELGYRF